MKKFKCENIHAPPDYYGDCIAACMRTLTQNPDVPHFFSDAPKAKKAWQKLRVWLGRAGFELVLFHLDSDGDPFAYMKENNRGFQYMLLCSTGSGSHAIVCQNDKVIADPAWKECSNYKPINGEAWAIGMVFRK